MLKILQYVKKFVIWIVLFCIIAVLGTYMFLNKKQSYTSSVIIEYTNQDAKQGYAPDGTEIDPSEILSSNLISNVIDNLGLSVSADYIRNRLKITEIISDDEVEKKEAALKNGQEYEYFPTKYTISFTVNASQSKDFASDVLNNLLNEYYIYYSENHINKDKLPANTKTLLNSSYDYLETVEIMDNSVSDILDYLNTQKTNYPDYRSSKTGYSFSDLYSVYENVDTDTVPRLFSYVLQNKITYDQDLLIMKYNNRIHKDELDIETKKTQLTELKSLIDSYANKSKEQIQYKDKNDDNENLVLKNVETNTSTNKTTYDDLILQYVDTLESRKQLDVDIDYCKNILQVFNENINTSSDIAQTCKDNIEKENEKIETYYHILYSSVTELNEVLGTSNIEMKSNLIVNETINMKIYMMLAFCAFIILGCGGAIVLGRLYEIIYHILYFDKKTGLFNRTKCDQLIEEYAKEPVLENMFIVLISIQNLKDINNRFGRNYGDKVLMGLGKTIQKNCNNHSDLTYNGTNQFLLFFHDSSDYLVNSYIDEIKQDMKKIIDDVNVELKIGITNPLTDDTYKIRELITKVYQKVNN